MLMEHHIQLQWSNDNHVMAKHSALASLSILLIEESKLQLITHLTERQISH